MKRMLKTLLALTASAVLWAGQANAILIDINVVTGGQVTGGDTVTIEVNVSDLMGDNVGAYDMDILFDAAVFDAAMVTFSGLMGFTLSSDAFTDFVLGILDVAELSLESDDFLLALQGGDAFTLFTVDFTVSALVEGLIDIPDFGFDWSGINDVKCRANVVCYPASVPEPGTLGLLGLGLLGLGLARRRRMS